MNTQLIENNGFKEYLNLFCDDIKNDIYFPDQLSINLKDLTKKYNSWDPGVCLFSIISIYLFLINNCKEYSLVINDTDTRHLTIQIKEKMTFEEVLYLLKVSTSKDEFKSIDYYDKKTNFFEIRVLLKKGDSLTLDEREHADFCFIVNIETATVSFFCKRNISNSLLCTIAEQMKLIANQVVTNKSLKINKISYVSEHDKIKMSEWNFASFSHSIGIINSIDSIIKSSWKQKANDIAILHEKIETSYNDLNKLSNKIVQQLNQMKLSQQTRVGIFFRRSTEMIASIFGTLKAGHTYIPIDIQYPSERIKTIIEDADVRVILTASEYINRLNKIEFNPAIKIIDFNSHQLKQEMNLYEIPLTQLNSIAYIIFTSGSTGKPKGVKITHGNLLNYAEWFIKTFQVNENSVIDFSSSIGFDISIPCTIVPLLAGAKVSICSEEIKLDPMEYIYYLEKNRVTHVELTPDYFNKLLAFPNEISKLNHLHWVLLGADTVVKKDVDQWLILRPNDIIVNEYGPTECTVAVTAEIVTKNNIAQFKNSIPIGKVIDGVYAYVLDKHLNLCPIGVRGILYIGGKSVSQGYLSEQQTNESFIQDPFLGKKSILYKTGDIVRWLPNGSLEYHGRIDDQIKINGHRIELQEIENLILQNTQIKQAKVLLHEDKRGKFLVAYLVRHESLIDDPSPIKRHLRKFLPYYMQPKDIIFLEQFPTMTNEKIDTSQLREMFYVKKIQQKAITESKTHMDKLINIFQEIFAIKQINNDDDFFDLGGDSLLALRLINKISEEFDIKLELHQLFEYSRISELWNLVINYNSPAECSLSLFDDFYPKLIKLAEKNNMRKILLMPPVGAQYLCIKNWHAY